MPNSPSKKRWRWVVGYEGTYQVSTQGDVRGVARFVGYRFPRSRRAWKSRPLVVSRNSGGYCVVTLSKQGVRKNHQVHALVLTAFAGACPKGCQCRHFPDSDRSNNCLSNLQWGSAKENASDRDIHGNTPRGKTCGKSKLTEAAIEDIRSNYRLRRPGATLAYFANKYDVSQTAIHNAVLKRTWRTLNRKRRIGK